MLKLMRALARDRKGATAIEYGLIVSLVIIGMIVALTNFADTSIGMWNNISNKVQNPN
jgi:pilus assembly protein Flp/PilA